MSLFKTVYRASKGATCAALALAVAVSGANAQTIIVNDSFADGITNNGTNPDGSAQIGFNVTSSNFALDTAQAPGPMDFASGNSGRTIHGIFPAQTLAAFGDVLTVTFDFTTPAAIANDNGVPSSNEDFKFGIFDTSGTAGAIDVNTMLPIDFNGPVNTNSGLPNIALNGLAGFMGEIDNINAAGTDLGVRTNNVNGLNGTQVSNVVPQGGQFLQSNSGFDFIAGSPNDDVVLLTPNTDYTGTLSVEFTDSSLTTLELTVAMADAAGVTIDTFTRTVSIADNVVAGDPTAGNVGVNTTTFDMLAFHATSGAFGGTDDPANPGSSNVGEANNGIDISNITIEFTDSTAMVLKGDVDLNGTVNFLDINPFIQLLSSNGYSAEADCDCDGDLDFLDIQPFIDILAGN